LSELPGHEGTEGQRGRERLGSPCAACVVPTLKQYMSDIYIHAILGKEQSLIQTTLGEINSTANEHLNKKPFIMED